MASVCRSFLHLCRVRVTRLDAAGHPTPGPNNVYVTDKPLSLAATPVILEGVEKEVIGGCDCSVANYRGNDRLKRFDLELAITQMEPALIEMMTGATVIVEGGKIAGLWWPSQAKCSSTPPPTVALEAWQDAWNEDEPSDAPFQYARWIWPASRWRMGDHTLENEFLSPTLMGSSRPNSNWGIGIYGDQPEAAQPLGGFWLTSTQPPAVCDYQTEGLT